MTTEYKGVSYKKNQRKWAASLSWKGEQISCGSWETPLEAAKERDRTILRLGLPLKKLQVFKKVNNGA